MKKGTMNQSLQSESLPRVSTQDRAEFEQWAAQVKQQMIACLKRRGAV